MKKTCGDSLVESAVENSGDGSRIITLKEAAKMLCCSYSTARRLAADGELRAFRVRGAWRTSAAACEAFIERSFAEQRAMLESIELPDGRFGGTFGGTSPDLRGLTQYHEITLSQVKTNGVPSGTPRN